MKLQQCLATVAPDRDTIVTVGVFDGVHQGHCHLLRRLVELARPQYLPTVLTFVNHPITVLQPQSDVRYITTPEERVRLLKEQGVELVVCLDFTQELSQVTADDFVREMVNGLRMKGLVAGPDSALGRGRQGDLDFLKRKGEELGFWVDSVQPLVVDGDQVKSRRIRWNLAEGDVATCAKLLGRKFSLDGIVVKGYQRGQTLGFPTANIQPTPHMALPGDGIYATWAIIDGVRHPSATSIGVRPTFNLSERLIEVYVMGDHEERPYDADLYGKRLGVEFVSKLRDQETFDDVDALVVQINRDVADSRAALNDDMGADLA
jgi:riboflavin kinase/FMN adenylyltransferase